MKKSAQIRILEGRLKAARDRIGIYEEYLNEMDLERGFEDWFWSGPESG